MKNVISLATFLALSMASDHVLAQTVVDPKEGLASATGLFGVSRDPKGSDSLTELTGSDIRRACSHSWNDRHCLTCSAHDAA